MKFKVQAIKGGTFKELMGPGIEIYWYKDYIEGVTYKVEVFLDAEKKPRYSERVKDAFKSIDFNNASPRRVKVRVMKEGTNQQIVGSIIPRIVAIEDIQVSVPEHDDGATHV